MDATLKKIQDALSAKGYVLLPHAPVFSKRDAWYALQSDESDIFHFVNLSYKPKAKAFGVLVGVCAEGARAKVIENLSWIKQHLDPIYSLDDFAFRRPCLQMFDAGRALRWDAVYVIPNPSDRGGWPILMQSLFSDFLDKYFFPIRDGRGIIDVLARDSAPFEWSLSNSPVRVAEMIATAACSLVPKDALMELINPHLDDLARDLHNISVDDFIQKLFASMY